MSFKDFLVGLCIVLLIGAGVAVILQSQRSYEASLAHYEAIKTRLLDPKFTKPVMLPVPGYSLARDGYSGALPYFMLALGLGLVAFLFPRLQNLSIGPGGLTFALREVQQNLTTIIEQNNTTQGVSAGTGGKGGEATRPQARFKLAAPAAPEDDPQKGQWGGQAENNLRRLSATVTESPIPGFYEVTLKVVSLNKDLPLKGLVKFHLHPTFQNPSPVIAAQNGEAVLQLPYVYGAFTVGAEADEGKTKLEYDLAEDKSFPKAFRAN
jgi:hypothetical protein